MAELFLINNNKKKTLIKHPPSLMQALWQVLGAGCQVLGAGYWDQEKTGMAHPCVLHSSLSSRTHE